MSGSITPFLWYNDQALEAATHYVAAFKNSAITQVQRVGDGPDGKILVVNFTLDGRPYIAMNGGPHQPFNDAFSLMVSCEDQAEVDRLWAHLSQGGTEVRCGWLQDRFGLRWQVVPKRFFELMADPDPARTGRVFAAMMQMVKFDIAGLERAYQGTGG